MIIAMILAAAAFYTGYLIGKKAGADEIRSVYKKEYAGRNGLYEPVRRGGGS